MIKITRDGRTIRTGKDYSAFRRDLYIQQRARCCKCMMETGLEFELSNDYSFHVSHRGSRGMGSGIRDDVVGPKRGQVEGGKCGRCHRLEHGQQSSKSSQLHWTKKTGRTDEISV